MWSNNDDRQLPEDMGVNTINLFLTCCLSTSSISCTHPEDHADFTADTHAAPRATKTNTLSDPVICVKVDKTYLQKDNPEQHHTSDARS